MRRYVWPSWCVPPQARTEHSAVRGRDGGSQSGQLQQGGRVFRTANPDWSYVSGQTTGQGRRVGRIDCECYVTEAKGTLGGEEEVDYFN